MQRALVERKVRGSRSRREMVVVEPLHAVTHFSEEECVQGRRCAREHRHAEPLARADRVLRIQWRLLVGAGHDPPASWTMSVAAANVVGKVRADRTVAGGAGKCVERRELVDEAAPDVDVSVELAGDDARRC